MAIAYGAAGANVVLATAGTSWAVPYPATVAADDLLIIFMRTNGGAVTTPAGWTSVYAEATVANPKGGVYIKKAAGGETGSVTVTTASTTGVAVMLSYTGVDTTTPQDVAAVTVAFDGTTNPVAVAFPSITTVTAGAVLIAALCSNSTTVTHTATVDTVAADFERVEYTATVPGPTASAFAGALYEDAQPTAGAKAVVITQSAARAYWGVVLALRPGATSTNYTPSAADPEGVTDAKSFVQTTVKAAADPAGITDAKTLVQTQAQTKTDALGATDSVSDGVGRAPADPAGITDASSVVQTTVEVLADPEGLTDKATGRTGTFYTFDDGTAQTWTAQTAGAGTLAIDAAGAHDGAFGLSANVPAATVDVANLVHDIPGTTEATVSGWWRVTAEGATGSNVPFARFFNGTQRVADVYRQNVAAGANVWLRVVKAVGGANYWFLGAAYTLPLNTWVYVDFTWNVATGVPELWINGRQYLGAANTPADWLLAPQIDRVYLGSQEPGNAGAWNIDQVNVSPVVPLSTNYTPSAADAEGLTDAATVAQDGDRAAADAVAGSDAATVTQALNAGLADPLGLADTTQAVQSAVKAAADALAGADAAQTVQAQSKAPADTGAGSDVVTAAQAAARTAADAVAGSDTVTPVQSLAEALADPAGITDATTAVQTTVEAAADTLAGSDVAALAQDGQRSTTDALAGADAVAAVQALIESVADAAGLSDTLLSAAGNDRAADDALGASDSASYSLVNGGVGATDSAGLTDAATAAQTTARTASDPASAGDVVTTAAAAARAAADALAGTEAVTGALGRSRAPADSATVTDSITVQRTYAVPAADQGGMVDGVSYVLAVGGVIRDLVLTLVPAENRWATRRLAARFELDPAAARLVADAQADPYNIEPLANRWGLERAD